MSARKIAGMSFVVMLALVIGGYFGSEFDGKKPQASAAGRALEDGIVTAEPWGSGVWSFNTKNGIAQYLLSLAHFQMLHPELICSDINTRSEYFHATLCYTRDRDTVVEAQDITVP